MKKIRKPVFAAAGLSCGIALAEQFYSFRCLPTVIVLSFLFIMHLIFRNEKGLKIFVLFCLLGLSVYFFHDFYNGKIVALPYTEQTVEIKGEITGFPYKDNQGRWRFQLKDIYLQQEDAWQPYSGKLDVYLENKEKELYPPGAHVLLQGRLGLNQGRVNFGDPDWDLIQKRKNIVSRLFAQEGKIIESESKKSPISTIWKLRRSLFMALFTVDDNIEPRLKESTASLLMSLSFGIADDLATDLTEDFQKAGLLHLLAVSGGNVAFFIIGLRFLLLNTPFTRKKEYLLSVAFILFFMILTELEPSVVRAGIMAIILSTTRIILRRTHWPSVLAVMLLILLPVCPNLLFETGFLLSLAAVWGLFAFTGSISLFLKNRLKLPDFLAFPLAATLSAQLGVLPLSLYYFQEISLVAPLSNLVFTPLIIPAMPLLLLLWLTLPFGPVFSWLYGLAELYAWILVKAGNIFASLPWSSFNLPKPDLSIVFLIYIFLLFFSSDLVLKYKIRIRIATLSFFLILAIICWHPWPYSLEVHMIDVGQGDSILLRLPNGKTMLIDGGGSGTGFSEVGKNTVHPYLKRLGLNSIDILLLSHGHSDHFQGLIQVADRIKYKKLLHGLVDLSNLPDELTNWLDSQPEQKKVLLFEGDRILLDKNILIEVMQAQVFQDGDNNDSLVLHITYKQTDIWLTGDLEKEGESVLLPKINPIEADTLFKVPHHGGASSCTHGFLAKISPEISLISVAPKNRYNHPAESTLVSLQNYDSIVLTTAKNGGIICKSDGFVWTWRTCLP